MSSTFKTICVALLAFLISVLASLLIISKSDASSLPFSACLDTAPASLQSIQYRDSGVYREGALDPQGRVRLIFSWTREPSGQLSRTVYDKKIPGLLFDLFSGEYRYNGVVCSKNGRHYLRNCHVEGVTVPTYNPSLEALGCLYLFQGRFIVNDGK